MTDKPVTSLGCFEKIRKIPLSWDVKGDISKLMIEPTHYSNFDYEDKSKFATP